jgi:hypothetical protein
MRVYYANAANALEHVFFHASLKSIRAIHYATVIRELIDVKSRDVTLTPTHRLALADHLNMTESICEFVFQQTHADCETSSCIWTATMHLTNRNFVSSHNILANCYTIVQRAYADRPIVSRLILDVDRFACDAGSCLENFILSTSATSQEV